MKKIIKKIKESKIQRWIEYAWMDCYAYVIRNKKTGKFICSWWSEKECEEEYKKILTLTTTKWTKKKR